MLLMLLFFGVHKVSSVSSGESRFGSSRHDYVAGKAGHHEECDRCHHTDRKQRVQAEKEAADINNSGRHSSSHDSPIRVHLPAAQNNAGTLFSACTNATKLQAHLECFREEIIYWTGCPSVRPAVAHFSRVQSLSAPDLARKSNMRGSHPPSILNVQQPNLN